MSIIKLKNVSKFYYNKTTISSGFTKLNLELSMGEFVVITGESGSGKSTLLNVISGLDSYEEGEMYINGEETSHYTEVDYENYRRKYIGNIFQNFNLVNSYTVYQNVELVLLLNGYTKEEVKKKVLEIIETVGLTKYKNTKASKLSGGQKQRVAIARALAKDTPIIVADEPTGNLDLKSAKSIMKLLKEISKNKLVVIVTHNYEQVEEYATRKISMNDGKIIEDKRITDYISQEAEEVRYKDLTRKNKVILGFRNAFNIKTKFVLLFLVYFFLTLLVFSEYSSLKKSAFDASLEGSNHFFTDKSPERIVLRKKDKKIIEKKDIDKLNELPNIKSVIEDDLLLDFEIMATNEDIYVSGAVKPSPEGLEVDKGTAPKGPGEIVIVGSKDSYYLMFFEEDLLGKELSVANNNTGSEFGKMKITGIKYDNSLDDFTNQFYVPESSIESFKQILEENYSDLSMTVNGNTFKSGDYEQISYNIKSSKDLAKGSAYVFGELNGYCDNYNCLNKKITFESKNIYFNKHIELEVKEILTKDNFNHLLNLKYESYPNTIFISEEDYSALFPKDEYQVSVFVEDVKDIDETIKDIENLGYYTYSLKDNLVDPSQEVRGIILMMRSIVFAIATGSLFFISYVIIKIILKSRNVYFSTIRILGATKRVAKQLLDIELLVDINIAYMVFALSTILARSGIINSAYLLDMTSFFTFKDYALIYLVLVIMSLLISNRYAHKLFKFSVMSTYREEV